MGWSTSGQRPPPLRLQRGRHHQLLRDAQDLQPAVDRGHRRRYFWTSPAVANGVVYIGSQNNTLYAFSAAGTTGCSGPPRPASRYGPAPAAASHSRRPRWPTGWSTSAQTTATCTPSAPSRHHRLLRDPKTCKPLWTGTIPQVNTGPASTRRPRWPTGWSTSGQTTATSTPSAPPAPPGAPGPPRPASRCGPGPPGRPLLVPRGGQRGRLRRVKRRPFLRLQPIVPARRQAALLSWVSPLDGQIWPGPSNGVVDCLRRRYSPCAGSGARAAPAAGKGRSRQGALRHRAGRPADAGPTAKRDRVRPGQRRCARHTSSRAAVRTRLPGW